MAGRVEGKVAIVTGAIRDEGTSLHYLPIDSVLAVSLYSPMYSKIPHKLNNCVLSDYLDLVKTKEFSEKNKKSK